MSRSRTRRSATRGEQPQRIADRVRRITHADPRLAREIQNQHDFAREQMRLEAEADFHLPQLLGEPEPRT